MCVVTQESDAKHKNQFHIWIYIYFIRISLPHNALITMETIYIQTLLWGFLLSSNRVHYKLSWILWADHLDGGKRDDGLFISPHLLDRVAHHLHGEGLLHRGVEHLHRPPPRLHLPAGAQASHCWLLISPKFGKGMYQPYAEILTCSEMVWEFPTDRCLLDRLLPPPWFKKSDKTFNFWWSYLYLGHKTSVNHPSTHKLQTLVKN